MLNSRPFNQQGVWIPASLVIMYAILLAFAQRSHVFWRDEAEAWIVARNSYGLQSLLHNVRYEGHPVGWYAVLYGVTRFTWNVEWMKLPNYIFAVAAATMVLSARRVALPVRIGLVFSYFFLFEYAVIDRNYMMGVTCLLAALCCMRNEKTSFGVPVMLSLAALTSLPALIIAVCFFPLHLLMDESLSDWQGMLKRLRALHRLRIAGIVLFALCVLGSLAEIRPPADSGLMLDSNPPQKMVSAVAVTPLIEVAMAYLPLPVPRAAFWDATVMNKIPRGLGAATGLVLASGLFVFFRRKAGWGFFFAATVLLLGQMAVSRRDSIRHVGSLFVVFALMLLLEEIQWFRGQENEITGWRSALLYGVLSVQVVSGFYALFTSEWHAFSGSRATAQFLKSQGLDTQPIVFAPDYVGLPVLAYLQLPSAYSVAQHAPTGIVVWNTTEFYTRHLPNRVELEAVSPGGARPVLVTGGALSKQEVAELGVKLLAKYQGEVLLDKYFIYR